MSNSILPDLSAKLVSQEGRIDPTWVKAFRKIEKNVNTALAALEGTDDDDEVAVVYASKSQEWSEAAYIELADDKDYPFIALNIAGSIDEVVTECQSGTCDLEILIGALELGGGGNAVSTTRDTVTHASDKTIADGDDVTIRITNNANAEGVSVTLRGSRTLA